MHHELTVKSSTVLSHIRELSVMSRSKGSRMITFGTSEK